MARYGDRWLVAAAVVALALRLVPMLIWMDKPCVRDECTYQEIARAFLAGKGMIGTNGWLWAPAYPLLMAAHTAVFGLPGSIEITQVILGAVSTVMLYDLTRGELGQKAARISAWLYALNPTFIFYASSLWSETIYSTLLLGAILSLRWARHGGGERGWAPGVLAGACVLFRGVATYMLPIFVLALVWGRVRSRQAWAAAVGCVLAAALVVAPYSFYATQKFGGLVVSDRTMGQMMWLGNNDFPPMAFDWGSGQLSKRAYERYEHRGRKHCGFKRDPVRQDTCEAAAGKAWILANPVAFLERIPVRVSQMLTPHSFLTRHLRWGRWRGMPQEVDEALIVSVVGFSFLTLVGGTIGIGARGRSWYAATAACLVLYHVAAIAVLAGLSRYRLPLEPLWTVFVGGLLADPRGAWAALKTDRLRLVTTAVLSLALIAVMLRYLPAGWPWWARW